MKQAVSVVKNKNENLVPESKIPISYLFDYIKEGYTIADFIASYPWLKRKNVEKALDEIKKREFSSHYAFQKI